MGVYTKMGITVIFASRNVKFCVVVDIEVIDKLGEKFQKGCGT